MAISALRGDSPLHQALTKGDGEAFFKTLFNDDANPNVRNTRGETPLHLAARENNLIAPFALLALLKAGADPNVQDSKGNTPLHIATQGHFLDRVLALLDAGADPNMKAKDGTTPLHRTLVCRENARVPAVIVALLNGGADPKVTMHFGASELIEIPPWFVVAHEKSQCPTDLVDLLRGQ